MMDFRRGLVPLVAACLVFAAGTAAAGPRIVNGLNTQDFPTTGALLYSQGGAINNTNASSWCTGTLIGCQTFLTAAHCVNEDTNATHYWVYLQHGGLAAVSSIAFHPSYNPNLSGRDVAVIKLSSPVTGIDPTPINTTHDLQALGLGLGGVVSGFGRTGGGSDYGVKRYGDIVTADCNTSETNGESNDVLVCWDYASPVGPAGTDSNTCNGDSGGPLFMDFAGTTEVVGITSAGVAVDCQAFDHSWDASVYHNASWINGQLGADSTSSCGGLAPVGDSSVLVLQDSGNLSSGSPTEYLSVNLVGTPSLVRFTLNGTDNGSFNPNFFVKQGAGASAALFDCKADGATVFGACEFSNPTPGPWSILVQRASGAGEFQVTTTVFGGDPPVCGNNTVESGEECDGSDLGTCPLGPCQACACPAPTCGNSVLEAGESCDGASDAACPGQCDGDCSCLLSCTRGDLYGLRIQSNAKRLKYKGLLYDFTTAYQDLNPSNAPLTLEITDSVGVINLAIPAGDSGWTKVDPIRRKYRWKGDGTLGGLRQVKLQYRDKLPDPYWKIQVNGRWVVGGDSIDVVSVLDFNLGVDGTCHLETW